MGLTSFLFLVVIGVHYSYSTYLALAPAKFHPGWKYSVQLTVHDVPNPGVRVTVTGNIFNTKKQSLGAGTVSLDNGHSARLEINVGARFTPDPNNSYTLQLDGSGGLSFSNSTAITLDPLTHLTFIQTDKKIYKAGQLVRFRVLTVDKDLVPQKTAKNITIQDPRQNTLARFYCGGAKGAYEGTYRLTDFPDLGDWKIVVKSTRANIDEEILFKVDEYVLPTFEVSAEVTPGFLTKDSTQKMVTVSVTATYTYGKGVLGLATLTVLGSNQVVRSKISDTSGKTDVEIDLSREVALAGEDGDSISINVEVTDEARRTYETMATVRVEKQMVKLEFDHTRTDLVYHTRMPYRAVVRLTDPTGRPLEAEYLENQMNISLTGNTNTTLDVSRMFMLTPGQTDVVLDIARLNSTNDHLTLTASLVVNGRKYEATESVSRYRTLGNMTLNARWITNTPVLTMGSVASFVVDVCNSTHFSSITYMIVSRGNIQTFGTVMAGVTTKVMVTTDMCPKGRLVVYGITNVTSTNQTPEVIVDSLELKLEHCQDKRVTPSVPIDSQRTGSYATLNVDVTWTDPSKQRTRAIGQHDVYLLAVDKSILLLQGDNDFTLSRVEKKLNEFNLPPVSAMGGLGGRMAGSPTESPGHFNHHQSPSSTGDLLKELGLVLLTQMNWVLPKERPVLLTRVTPGNNGPGQPSGGTDMAANKVTVRRDFPDTWIWKSAQTDDTGRVSMVEKLPDSITSWVISAFAVRRDTAVAFTAQPFQLRAFNPFFVTLKLPYSIRRTERFELRATVFNYENINVDTTVTLAPSDDYMIAGDSTKTTFVKRNHASSVTFTIVATKVKTINVRVTATARRSNGATITDVVEKKLIVKPQGVERTRAVIFPVILTEEQPEFDQNVVLDFSPWTSKDVVPDSRRVKVKGTGDMMGNALEDIDRLVTLPTGCGEQNMITTIPNIYAMAYLTAINDLKQEFETKAKKNMKCGYTKETQQYRWDNGGYSAFGKSDQAASTWLTAFVLRSFAQAKTYIPKTVDMDILNSAVEFLFTRQNRGNGLFFEQGRVIHDEMQGGTGAGDALSVYVVVCLLEARNFHVQINSTKLNLAINYVNGIASGPEVKRRKFLAAITAYATALNFPHNPSTRRSVERLVGHVTSLGAPWRQEPESGRTGPGAARSYHSRPAPNDIEITAYCLLAYNAINKVAEGRDLLLWLQKQQNSNGGFRSTQDTVMALQAISEYALNFPRGVANSNVVVTPLGLSSASPQSINIDSTNAALLQTMELPERTKEVNIRVTGSPGSLSVVKVVWYFHTAPETEKKPPSGTGRVSNNNRKLRVSTRTSKVKTGLYNVQACMRPEAGLDYNNMVLLTLTMPSGFVAEDLRRDRERNPSVMRMEEKDDQVHCYMNQPRDECVNIIIEETVTVRNLSAGTACLSAYYQPDIISEAEIQVGPCPGPDCRCTGDNCDSSHADKQAALSRLLLASCSVCLLSLAFAL